MSDADPTRPGPADGPGAPGAPGVIDCYGLFELEERYAVDRGEVDRRFRERSKLVHPDRFVGAEARERVQALQRSMRLNQAYKILKHPVLRAEHLLARHGVHIGDREVLSPAFLMEILELREELAEAKAAGEVDKLHELEEAMLDRQEHTLDEIAARFATFEAGGDRALLDEIKTRVIVMRYIRRYLDEFEDTERSD
ncbi:Fe-S protein assembly co-chaperone HscB [Haliangium sp.]|uniref:Fe-S protein assembly co-chaperone HscB n=1 Tax=Haliangium sp. TaxID=2663208 RepID=UPI003D0EDB3D